jgi:hypothetical protein
MRVFCNCFCYVLFCLLCGFLKDLKEENGSLDWEGLARAHVRAHVAEKYELGGDKDSRDKGKDAGAKKRGAGREAMRDEAYVGAIAGSIGSFVHRKATANKDECPLAGRPDRSSSLISADDLVNGIAAVTSYKRGDGRYNDLLGHSSTLAFYGCYKGSS